MHDWIAEEGNIRSPRIQKATSARWIQQRIERMGAPCSWFGAAPFDDDLYEEPGQRAFHVGTLAHSWYGWKNTRAVLEIFPQIQARFPDAELWSYGQTSMAVPGRFFVRPDPACLRFIYSRCRVWVVPSISEGLGMCGFEAMLCGAPVVSADNRGIREFADETTCLIYPPADLDLMLSHVLSLLADWDYGKAMANRAKDHVTSYSFNDCLDRIEALLGGGTCP
jgi:glycosyltransferase involved in cell wall biosynthesis